MNEDLHNDQKQTVSVIVVTFRSGDILGKCLSTVLAEAELRELIVVDNGNDCRNAKLLDEYAARDPRVKLLRPGRNLGFAAGCNLGGEHATGEYVALVNPDLEVPPGTFTKILRHFAAIPDAWLCGGRLLNMDGTEQRGGRREILTPWRAIVEILRLDALFPNHPHFRRLNHHTAAPQTSVAVVPSISGAFMVMRRNHWNGLGGMDDNMFLHMEDMELCLRVLNAGGLILYCGDTPVYHHLSTSDVSRGFVEWHKTRSATYYFAKQFRGTYPLWALWLLNLALWARFILTTLRTSHHDVRRLFRRLSRRAG